MALRKDALGLPLSKKELMIVQWTRNGFGCAACGPRKKKDRPGASRGYSNGGTVR